MSAGLEKRVIAPDSRVIGRQHNSGKVGECALLILRAQRVRPSVSAISIRLLRGLS